MPGVRGPSVIGTAPPFLGSYVDVNLDAWCVHRGVEQNNPMMDIVNLNGLGARPCTLPIHGRSATVHRTMAMHVNPNPPHVAHLPQNSKVTFPCLIGTRNTPAQCLPPLLPSSAPSIKSDVTSQET
jgi:hypothetical protein